MHVHQGRFDLFNRSDGLSGNTVSAFLEDHEGSVWVVTVDGVDRFREYAVTTISIQQGLSSERGVRCHREGRHYLDGYGQRPGQVAKR